VVVPGTRQQTAMREGEMTPMLTMQGGRMPNFQRVSQNLALQRSGSQPGALYYRESDIGVPMMQTEAGHPLPAPDLESDNRLILQREGGNVLRLGREGAIGLNSQPYTTAAQRALAEQMSPLNLQEGYDSAMREKAVALATSGIERQKEHALARLKEEQMKAGNFGSSVGQREMAELARQYDEQLQNAERQIDIRNMEAARQDRYANLMAQQARLRQLADIAGLGQNLELAGAQFGRHGVSADNAATMAEQEFARRGRAADNAAMLQEAQFGREGRRIDEETRRWEQMFGREGRQMDNTTAMQLAQYGRQGREADYLRDMEQARFRREGMQLDNAAALQEQQFAREGAQLNNQIEQLQAEFARQGIQLDNATLMQMAQYGREGRATDFLRDVSESQRDFQNRMELERFMREGRGIDFANRNLIGEQDWRRQMEAEEFNRENQAIQSDEDWRRYQELQRRAERAEEIGNEAQRYNLENLARENEVRYGRYRNAISDLANYANGNPYDPQSAINADVWQRQEADRQARLNAFINTGLASYGASHYGALHRGTPASIQPQAPIVPVQVPNFRFRGTMPSYHGNRALALYRRAA